MKRTLYTVYKDRYRYLFTAALAVCGNEILAEDVLADAVTEAGVAASFDRSLGILMRRALENAGEDCQAEFLCDSPVSDESAEVRRAVLLRYGLRLPVSRISKLMGMSRAQLRDMLARVSGRKGIARACEKELRSGFSAPDPATFRSMLEGRKAENSAADNRPAYGRALAGLVLVLLIGAMIWLGSVMIDYYVRTINTAAVEVTDADG